MSLVLPFRREIVPIPFRTKDDPEELIFILFSDCRMNIYIKQSLEAFIQQERPFAIEDMYHDLKLYIRTSPEQTKYFLIRRMDEHVINERLFQLESTCSYKNKKIYQYRDSAGSMFMTLGDIFFSKTVYICTRLQV